MSKKKKSIVIIRDTREPDTITFGGLNQVSSVFDEKLDFGDYSTHRLKNLVVIERKTKSDLFGTLGKGRARFLRELDRALEAGVKYFYLVIESDCSSIYNGHWVRRRGMKPMLVRPYGSNIIMQLISFVMHHPLNVIPVFASNQKTTERIIRDILLKAEDYLDRGILTGGGD